MADTLKLVICGDNWPAQQKLADNLLLKMPAEATLASHAEGICKLMKVKSLDGFDVHKGKGKPPNVEAGTKLRLEKSAREIGDKGGLVVLYFKNKEAKKKPEASNVVKLLLCGDKWNPPAKVSEYLMVSAKRDEKLETVLPDMLKVLGLASFDGWELSKGRGKAPNVTAGVAVSLNRTPDSLNLSAAALMYVAATVANQPKQEHRSIYQLGACVEVLDDDINEWLPGNVTLVREGSYDVTLDKGGVEKYVDPDDLRPREAPPPTNEATVPVDQQRAALKSMVDAFPNKSVAEIGGVLKSKNFNVEETRRLLKASDGDEEPKQPKAKKAAVPPKMVKVTMNEKSESLGLKFHCVADKVIINGVDEGLPFGRAGVTPGGVLVSMGGRKVTCKDDVLEALAEVREGSLTFEVGLDMRPEAKIWVGAPVDVCVDREWERGVVTAAHDDGTFDVRLFEDNEIEHGVPYEDLKLRENDIREIDEETGKNVAPPANPPATMPDHEGLMKKQGADALGLYKLRRFALYGSYLYYYHPNKPRPLGVLDLQNSVVISDTRKGKDWFAVGSKSLDRIYNFICGSPEEKEDWLVKLKLSGCLIKRRGEE